MKHQGDDKIPQEKKHPSVLSAEFWNNSPHTYESITSNESNMRWKKDDQGFPMFWNVSSSSGGSWYSVGNGTYEFGNHLHGRFGLAGFLDGCVSVNTDGQVVI